MANTLVVYYSRKGENHMPGGIQVLEKGNTEYAAEFIQKALNADIFEIDTVKPYAENYRACCGQAVAHKLENARPALARWPEAGVVEECRTLILCCPNYCGTVPMAVLTFLEQYDWSGRTVLPLINHGGGGAGSAAADIAAAAPGAEVREPLAIPGHEAAGAQLDIQLWLTMHGVGMEES